MTKTELRNARGKAIREKDRSAFTVTLEQQRQLAPDSWTCEGCPSWDDINGCWRGCKTIMQCPVMGEEMTYFAATCAEDDDIYNDEIWFDTGVKHL